MNCSICHTPNPTYARFCLDCGAALETTSALACPRCKVGLPAHAKFCFVCGLALDGSRASDGPAVAVPAFQSTVSRERRVVTILFADVKGFTAMSERFDPEDVVEIMDGAFKALIEPIHRYEGVLVRLMGDSILAFFGAPVAHENDPERACRAALDIIGAVRRYADRLQHERGIPEFSVRVGINTGLVVVGDIGADWHMEYTATGDAINLAARMETAAEPGTVLISADTHRHISHLFETQACGPLVVKGKTEPVRAFRLVKLNAVVEPRAVDESQVKRTPLIGRAAELSQLREAIRGLENGKGAQVAIVAEAGLGKRRLIVEAHRANAQRISWVTARCLSYTAGIAYWTAREMLRGLLGANGEAPPAEVDAALRKSIEQIKADSAAPSTLPDAYAYLARLLAIPLDDAHEAQLAHLSAENLQRQIINALTSYVRERARLQPLALVWENLQWVDSSSLAVLESLLALSTQAPLLMLLVFRPGEGRMSDLHRKLIQTLGAEYRVLELTPLTRDDSANLLDHLVSAFAPDGLPADVRERLLERAEGNPFFLEEMLRAWLDSGQTPAHSAEVPDSLQSVILARIDRLSPSHKRALQTAAVSGRVFQRGVLARVLEDTNGTQLAEALSELSRRDFIVPSDVGPDEQYSFRHNLTQEVTYNSLLIAQRKALHKRTGEAIEAQYPQRLEELAATLAHHFEKGESPSKALSYLMLAGQRAARLYANAETIDCYARALAIATEVEAGCAVRLLAHEGLGDVYGLVGAYASGVEQYALALECADQPRRRAALQRKTGRVYERWGKSEQAIACFEAGLREMRDELDAAEAGRIYTGLGLVYYRRGELDAALQLSALALDLMERSGDEWGIAQACNNLGIVHGQRGEWARAVEYHRRGLSIWERLQDANGLATAHNNLGFVYHQQGEWARAAHHYQTSLALCEQVGNRHGLAFAYDNLGQVYQKQGRTEQAMECLKKAVAILLEIGESQVVPEMWQSGVW